MARRPARQALLGVALLVGILLLLTTWTAICRDPWTLQLAGGAATLVLGVGIGARLLRAPGAAVVLAEVAALAGGALWVASGSGGIARLPTLVAGGVEHLREAAAPILPTAGSTLVLTVAVGLVALLADMLVIVLDRPGLAIVPLLVLLLVPPVALRDHLPPSTGLVWFALGLALVLLAARDLPVRGTGAALRASGLAVGLGTTCLALVTASVIAPQITVPSGRGDSGDAIRMNDVSQDLRREIAQGTNSTAFTYTSEDHAGRYMRLYSLPTFNAQGWHLTNSAVRTGALPAAPGRDQPGTRTRVEVTIGGFQSEWLPTPYAPVSHTAPGSWGYLPDSLAILALAGDRRAGATAGLTYSVESSVSNPTQAQILAAPAAAPPDADLTGSVPSDVTPELVQLANTITAKAATPGAKALAILRYLQQPQFRYSLDAQPGSGYEGLQDFLLEDHKGFCVQYAASMAILGRIAGVPTRLAIGFAPGRKLEGGRWLVTMHDMHAWPEMYLGGLGWVAFEPTPGGRGGTDTPDATSSPAPPPTAPTTTPTEDASATPSAAPSTSTATPGSDGGGIGFGWLPPVAALGGVVALVLAFGTPGWLRRRRRRARLAGGREPAVLALDAWAEVSATSRDYSSPVPAGSPRFAAEALAEWLPDPDAADGVRRLGIAVERAEYGGQAHPPETGDWAAVTAAASSALAERAPSRWARWRGRMWPMSVFDRPADRPHPPAR